MKVAIVGGAKESQMDAPFMDEEWEVWVLGNQITDYHNKRVSRIFEIHDNLSEHPDNYPQFLVDLGIKTIVSDKFPIQAENVEVYPYEEVDRMWGYHYQTSSASYMVAYAIHLMGDGVYSAPNETDEIALYGINMAIDNHEYYKQRNCLEAWLGFAKGLGIKVTIPDSSPILKSNYDEGRHWNNEGEFPLTEEAIKKNRQAHEQRAKDLMAMSYKHEGAIEVYETLELALRGFEAGQPFKLRDVNKG